MDVLEKSVASIKEQEFAKANETARDEKAAMVSRKTEL
jgi:hypothetical protein